MAPLARCALDLRQQCVATAMLLSHHVIVCSSLCPAGSDSAFFFVVFLWLAIYSGARAYNTLTENLGKIWGHQTLLSPQDLTCPSATTENHTKTKRLRVCLKRGFSPALVAANCQLISYEYKHDCTLVQGCAPRAAIRRPLRSLEESGRTNCKTDRGQKTFTIWCNWRLSNAKS